MFCFQGLSGCQRSSNFKIKRLRLRVLYEESRSGECHCLDEWTMVGITIKTYELGYKKTLQELDTYAQLRKDSRSSLPYDFTICSIIFSTNNDEHYPLTLLGSDEDLDWFEEEIKNNGEFNWSDIDFEEMYNDEN